MSQQTESLNKGYKSYQKEPDGNRGIEEYNIRNENSLEDLSCKFRMAEELVNLKINQLKLFSLKSRFKKK